MNTFRKIISILFLILAIVCFILWLQFHNFKGCGPGAFCPTPFILKDLVNKYGFLSIGLSSTLSFISWKK